MIPAASSPISAEISPISAVLSPIPALLSRSPIGGPAVADSAMPIVAWLTKHRKTLLNIVKHYETLVKHCATSENVVKHCQQLVKHHETLKTLWNIMTLKTLWNITKHSDTRHSMRRYRRSMRRHRCSRGVSGDVGNCGVCITPQTCDRVTNHGDMGTFSKPDHSRVQHHCFLLHSLYNNADV